MDRDSHEEDRRTVPISRRTLLSSVPGAAIGAALPIGTASARDDGDDESLGRLTPRPATTGDGDVRSLNGTWEFALSTTIDDQGAEWREAEVPGQWGYSESAIPEGPAEWYPPEGQLGWYRREFEAPKSDRERLLLRFDAVYSEARVYLNGAEIGHHVGGYTPFEIDVTDHVEAGTNVLSVGVAQASPADDMAWQNVTGGITRDVTLVSVPEIHIADYDVRTHLQGSSATVDVETRIENASGADADATLEVTLSDPNGETVATTERSLSSREGGSCDPSTTLEVADPNTWNPEEPQLYTLEIDLNAGDSTERVTQRLGIREIEVVGDELRLNGEAVTLRGVNWEEIHIPDHGHAVPPELTREDARRLKEANVNYVRTAHHPTSEAFLDACDELGLVVEVEAPHTFVGRGRGDPYPEIVVSQTVEMVERDKNRTSVCLWSIANESEWYDAFETAGRLTKAIDPTRPTIFNYDNYDPDDPWHDVYDVRSQHYPAFRADSTIEEYLGLDDPILFDEYAHTYCYNGRELVTDPGLRDQWGIPFERIWERCRAGDSVAGGAIWAGGDHLERWRGYLWGLLDRHRRPRPEYWHVKKIYSPVRVVETEWLGNGNVLRLTIENRHEFVDLADRSIEFEGARNSGNRPIEAAPGERVTVTVPVAEDRLELRVTHPHGHTIEQAVFTVDSPGCESYPVPTGTPLEIDEESVRTTEGPPMSVDRNTGRVEVQPEDGQGTPVVVGGPELVLTPTEAEASQEGSGAIDHRPDGRTVTDVRVVEDGAAVAIDVEYAVATGTFVLRPVDGGVEVEYEFEIEEALDVREVGVALPLTRDLTTLSWRREGQWSTYPDDHIGRTEGTAVAFPEGTRPDHEEIRLGSDRPWKDDATSHGSNDFRGTKRNVYTAALVNDHGAGVQLRSEGDHHVRAQVRSESVDLLALERSLSGTNPFGWMNRQPVLNEDPTIEADEIVRGNAAFEIRGSPSV
ncbi:Beta-galactosidase [Haloterrigena turkmenica DSM 5511]|uniref:Beta-galactosidase n=1 Tax=Haloterrigena turkmenica (strain ATCC 51198 / DSM 5511 / JCM 9101 / NCIMB 13204 / VKM B-1734 / 4k) TaxID=543526 RepID=D2RZ19_HALTV|nr:Beta-galactosidase [Haloterrigena turkmenica DSM 5511]